MRRLRAALQFLTRLPVPGETGDADDFAASIRWFPVAGGVVGLVVAGAGWLGMRVDGWTGALAALIAWTAVTGALHLDGLGDVADAVGAAHRDPAKITNVLADPHIGSFGVVAIGLQLLAKLVLLHGLLDHGPLWWLVAIPFTARMGPLGWARWLPPLHPGLGARFSRAVRIRDLAGWFAVLSGVAVKAPFLMMVVPLVLVWWWWLRRRLGGVSGDGHGAGIELVESGLLWAACLMCER